MLTIYGLETGCEPRKEAKQLCIDNNIEHEFIAIDNNERMRALVRNLKGSVPLILQGDLIIGGRDELKVWLKLTDIVDAEKNKPGSIKSWFEEAVPAPTDKNLQVQLGCHFEEVAEMLETLEGGDGHSKGILSSALEGIERLANTLKSGNASVTVHDKVEFLDSACDQIVTATATTHMLGMDFIGAISEVNNSNWSKFVDGKPVFDENGKIRKGPNYKAPDLAKYVQAQ